MPDQSHATSSAVADLDRLRPVEEARATVLRHASPLPAEHVGLIEAIGRTLAEDLIAQTNQPPFPAATMDGYAVLAEDASPWREVIGAQMAGATDAPEVTDGTAVRITTGAPLPPGANAVVPVELTEMTDDDHVIIHAEEIHAGQNVRPVGFDVRKGDLILPAGTVVGPAEIGLIAAEGWVPVPVRRRPKVSVLSTGDELVEPTERLGPGQIRDSNRFSVIAAVQQAGAEVVWAGKAPDEREPLRELLLERIAASDIVITSGGVSMGELDLVKALLGEIATVHFRRVFMKPGKPFNFATAGEDGRTLFFGLPGNPVSALAGFELFVRPAIATMLGRLEIERPRVQVTLTRATMPADRPEYQRAVVRVGADGRLEAHNTGVQASSRLASFVGANALLIVPPREVEYQPGDLLEAILLAPPLGPA